MIKFLGNGECLDTTTGEITVYKHITMMSGDEWKTALSKLKSKRPVYNELYHEQNKTYESSVL